MNSCQIGRAPTQRNRDPATGDVVLSRKPDNWEGFLALAARTPVPADFMTDREEAPAPERELF